MWGSIPHHRIVQYTHERRKFLSLCIVVWEGIMRKVARIVVLAVTIQLAYPLCLQGWVLDTFWVRDGACEQYFEGRDRDEVEMVMQKISDNPDYHCEYWLRDREA